MRWVAKRHGNVFEVLEGRMLNVEAFGWLDFLSLLLAVDWSVRRLKVLAR